MNYLLAETFQPEKKRVHPPEAAIFTGPSPRARFGRLKRGNMKQSGTPSRERLRSYIVARVTTAEEPNHMALVTCATLVTL
jgi:hypothetical protein